jgi:hypothetical protein
MSPLFVVVTELAPGSPLWRAAEAQAGAVAEACAPILGFRPEVELAALDPPQARGSTLTPGHLGHALGTYAAGGGELAFLLPAILDFGLLQKQALVEVVREARRTHAGLSVHYDDPDVCHRLMVQAFVESVWEALAGTDVAPARLGVLVVASGQGDAANRAKTYQLMRLLWEQLAFADGEVAFVRHPRPSLPESLERCMRSPLQWLALPQMLWPGEHLDYAKLLLDDFRAAHPDATALRLGNPVGARPSTTGWLVERLLSLWQAHRDRAGARMPSRRHDSLPRESCVHGPEASCTMDILPSPLGPDLAYGPAVIAEICDTEGLARLLRHFGVTGDRIFVKVTWHGYATGTYTDPIALDRLLSALPGKAVLLEGHTTGRNLGGASWDWETESESHRTWIRQQDLEFLRRTGLADVIARHGAQYINVTEAYWDGACAPRDKVLELLTQAGVTLRFPEIADYVPEVLLAHRGAPFISFARFKGPTRLCISNCFGLLPPPLRAAWHGATIDHFARVCCDVARLYGCLFHLFGLAEALHVAVRWNRAGLYRSRWGNYDLIADPAMITLSEGLPAADALASRLQGQNVRRSAFFAAVTEELGLPDAAITWPIEEHLIRRFA